ncbi:class I SAM-dependent methyltransferase [Candidatus Peregrinibacteria bacterium]|nr:class I SAM-dependent methyltransferase [Candidatus Peregrinibacteria bacterium]
MQPKYFFENCLRELAKEKLILDIGGGQAFQKDMTPYKDWFKDTKYLTVDQAAYNPSIIGNIHDLPFEDEYADGAICKAVLEHVYNPFKVVDEIHRVLKKGGKLLVWLPFLYPYHGNENYKDYYRYTRDGVEYLFRNFKELQIVPTKGYFQTMMDLTPVLNKIQSIGRFIDKLYTIHHQHAGFYIYGIK